MELEESHHPYFFWEGIFFNVLSHRKIKKIFFPFLYSYSGTNGPGITLNEKGRYPARRHQCVQRVAKGITKRNNPSLFFSFLFLLLYNFLSFLSFSSFFLSLSPAAAAAAATFVWQFWLGNLSDATPSKKEIHKNSRFILELKEEKKRKGQIKSNQIFLLFLKKHTGEERKWSFPPLCVSLHPFALSREEKRVFFYLKDFFVTNEIRSWVGYYIVCVCWSFHFHFPL